MESVSGGQTLRPDAASLHCAHTVGQGAFGKVHLLYDTVHGLHCIKHFRNDDRREIHFFNQLTEHHPNIVRPLFNGADHVALEYCNGGDLQQLIDANPCGLKDNETLVLLSDLANAIVFLHERQIYHRDIKPSNIGRMLSVDGVQYKLLDFGSCVNAAQVGERPLLTAMAGTRAFLHPALAAQVLRPKRRYEPLGGSVDLWSVGVTLLYAIAGRLPFSPDRAPKLGSFFRADTPRSELALCALPTHCRLSPSLRIALLPLLAQLVSNNLHYNHRALFDDVQCVLKLPALLVVALDPQLPVASLQTRILYGVDSMETLLEQLYGTIANCAVLETYFVCDQLSVQRELSSGEIVELSVKGGSALARYDDYERSARLICCVRRADSCEESASAAEASPNSVAYSSLQSMPTLNSPEFDSFELIDSQHSTLSTETSSTLPNARSLPFGSDCALFDWLCHKAHSEQVLITTGGRVCLGSRWSGISGSAETPICPFCSVAQLSDVAGNAAQIADHLHSLHLHADNILLPQDNGNSACQSVVWDALCHLRDCQSNVACWQSWAGQLRLLAGWFAQLQRDFPLPEHRALYREAAQGALRSGCAHCPNAAGLHQAVALLADSAALHTELKRLKLVSSSLFVRSDSACLQHCRCHDQIRRLLLEIQLLHRLCSNALAQP